MAQKSLEESIREYSVDYLENIVQNKRKDYAAEAIEIAEDELVYRKLGKLNPIEQIDFIRKLNDDQLSNLLKISSARLSPSHLNVIHTEISKRGLDEQEWYYLENNQSMGPITYTEMRKLVEFGKLLPYSYIFRKGTTDWESASSVPGLFEYSTLNLPPPPGFRHPVIGMNTTTNQEDVTSTDLGCGLSLICFLFPIIGVIIFFTEKDNNKGKNALAMAVVGFIVWIFCYYVNILSILS